MNLDHKKPTLIILPGWGGDKKTWDKFIQEVKNDDLYNCVCIELPCFGDEPCPKEIWGVEEYADFVKKQIDSLNVENPILLAHSFGGQIASYLIFKYPKLIHKLVLSGAAIHRPKKTMKIIIFGYISKLGKFLFKLPLLNKFEDLSKKVLYKITGSQDYNETSGMQREIFKKITKQDFLHVLPEIKIPTLVLWGKKDSYVPVKTGKKIADLIPNALLKVFPQGKHGLHLQFPKEIYDNINNFIKNK